MRRRGGGRRSHGLSLPVCGAFRRGGLRGGRRHGGRFRPLLPQLLHLRGAQGALSRRPVHPSRETGPRLRQSPAEAPGQDRRGAPLRPYGVDLPRLEQTRLDRLPQHRCRAHGRMDRAAFG